MAKKKSTHQPIVSKQDENAQLDQHNHPTESASDDPAEKLKTIKSLNSMLVKEIFERRQQFESLEHAKEELENELTRANQEVAVLEMEKAVFCLSVETQFAQMRDEIADFEIGNMEKKLSEVMVHLEDARVFSSRVSGERDEMKGKFDGSVVEVSRLRKDVAEMKERERKFEEEIGEMKRLMEEKEERVRNLEDALREEASHLEMSVKGNMELKRNIEGLVREKKDLEVERSGQQHNIAELEKEMNNLNEILLNLGKEEQVLREKVLEFEKILVEKNEKEKKMVLEINALVEEKRESKSIVGVLVEEKNSVKRLLDVAVKKYEDKSVEIDSLVSERNLFGELKTRRDNEIVELNGRVGELMLSVVNLEKVCADHEAEKKKLSLTISQYKEAFLDKEKLERERAEKRFAGEKKDSLAFKEEVSKMEKMIAVTAEELEQMKKERKKLLKEKEGMKSNVELLVREKEEVHKSLSDAQREIHDLKVDVAAAGTNSDKALSMLKTVAAVLCQSKYNTNGKKEVGVKGKKKRENEMQPYLAELERIQDAFKNKETVIEDLNKQVGLLNNSVAYAEKNKSFWVAVCSSMTIVLAISVAYAARGC